VAAIASRIPFSRGVKPEELTAAMVLYQPPEDDEGDDDATG
jgi:hypothetical protein